MTFIVAFLILLKILKAFWKKLDINPQNYLN